MGLGDSVRGSPDRVLIGRLKVGARNGRGMESHDDPVRHAHLRAGMSVGELAEEYGHAGFGAKNLHEAVDVATTMVADEDVTVLFGLAGAMVPAGMRAIVSDLIRDGLIDVLVTTGANLTHDAIEAIGGKHIHGDVTPPDRTEREHDEHLREEGIDRIYNVYLPQQHFATFEEHLRERVFPSLGEAVTIEELTAALGRANAAVNREEGIEEDAGIAAAAFEHEVPVYCPAIQDSILGLQAWLWGQVNPFTLDALSDMTSLNDLVYDSEETGALLVGGGVPKNYVLQSRLVTPGAHRYAVQLTMDQPTTGGLSGATLNEARSWGKIEPDGKNVSVYGDATITFPLLVGAVRERLS